MLEQRVSGSSLYIVNVVLAAVTLCALMYLLGKILQGYSSKKRELLSAYFGVCVILLLLQSITLVELLMPQQTFFWIFLDRLRSVGFFFFETFVVFFTLITPAPVKQTTLKAILLALAVTLVHIGLMFLYTYLPCGSCVLVFPAIEAVYSNVFATLFYVSVILLSCVSDTIRARQPGQGWTQFLLAFNAVFVITGAIAARPTDAGYCLITGTTILYRILYVPILYRTVQSDSIQVLSDKMFEGDADMMQEAGTNTLLFYRHKLAQLDQRVKNINFEDLYFGPKIGAGGYGEVYKGRWKHTDVAIKRVFKSEQSGESVDEFIKEISILSKLHHPNILLFLGASISNNGLFIITEYMSKGSVYSNLHSPLHKINGKAKIGFKEKMNLLLDAARGMLYLHTFDPPIIHRDLKTQNLLVDEYGRGKLCDFGLSREMASTTMSRLGTIQYSAPETLRGEHYGEAVDMYSFGILIWEVVTEEVPYEGLAPLKVASEVAYNNTRPKIPASCPPDVAQLISMCWHNKAKKRPSFSSIVQMLEQIIRKLDSE